MGDVSLIRANRCSIMNEMTITVTDKRHEASNMAQTTAIGMQQDRIATIKHTQSGKYSLRKAYSIRRLSVMMEQSVNLTFLRIVAKG